ncbi:MAG: hypothetical protein WEB30_14775 [Cyclobacteriaceae bacterium]
MVYYSHTIIQLIKAAEDDASLKEIIHTSFRELQAKRRNGAKARRGFILNMIMALKYLKAEGLSARETANVDKAVGILETLRGEEHENLF